MNAAEILEKDGYVEVENPCDKEYDRIELNKVVNECMNGDEQRLKSLIGETFSNGFEISDEIAEGTLRVFAPDKLEVEVSAYTIGMIGETSALVALDEDGKVVFTVKLPVETRGVIYTEPLNFEEHLTELKNEQQVYKKVRWFFYGVMVLGIFLVVGMITLLSLL